MTDRVEVEGVELRTDGDMVVQSSMNRWAGRFEPVSMVIWRSVVGGLEDDVAIDVGAYTGIYTIAAAQEGSQVVAVEPNPVAIGRLEENVLHNLGDDTQSVVAYAAAASSERGTAAIDRGDRADLTSACRVDPDGSGCRVLTVDSVVPAGFGVSAIKIDVEGHELAVLRGAEKTIQDFRPWLIVEALSDVAEARVGEFLSDHGYHLLKVDAANLVGLPLP